MEAVGQYLFTLRKNQGLTQAAVAKAVGATDTSVRQWEQGTHAPGLRFGQKLAKALNGDYADLEWLNRHGENIAQAGERLALDRLGKGDGRFLADVMARRLEESGVIGQLETPSDVAELLRFIAGELVNLPDERRATLLGELRGYIIGRRAAQGGSDQPPGQ